MGEGPATVRHRKTRYYAAIAAATVLGAGVAVARDTPETHLISECSQDLTIGASAHSGALRGVGSMRACPRP